MSDNQWPRYGSGDGGDPGNPGNPGDGSTSPWGREPTVTPSGGVPHETPTGYHPPPTPYPHVEGRRHRQPVLAIMLAVVLTAAIADGATYLLMGSGDDAEPTTGTTRTSASERPATAPVVPAEATAPVGPTSTPEDVGPTGSTGPALDGPLDLHSPDGLAALVTAVQERTGGSDVFEAVLYPEYAVVDVPVDRTSLREESLRWDGTFSEFGGKGTAMEKRIDLAQVDHGDLERLMKRARSLVDDPTTTYFIIRGRSTIFSDDGARIFAYASNEYSETGYVSATADGVVVTESGP